MPALIDRIAKSKSPPTKQSIEQQTINRESFQQSIDPPAIDQPSIDPAPCTNCGSPIYWRSIYSPELWCWDCSHPPDLSMIESRWSVILVGLGLFDERRFGWELYWHREDFDRREELQSRCESHDQPTSAERVSVQPGARSSLNAWFASLTTE